MDSSSVLAISNSILGSKQYAFSSVYSDQNYDESDEIRSMLNHNVEEWCAVRVEPQDIISVIEKMVEVHDEPVATATWLSHFAVCEEIKKKRFKTVFGGLGGDELNAGEYEHFFYHFADLVFAGKQKELNYEVARWSANHDHPLYRKSMMVVERELEQVVDLNRSGVCLPNRQRIDRYADAVNQDYFDIRKYQPEMDVQFESYLKNRTYQDIYRETAPCCLRAQDRQSSVFGLDHIDPFFDYRLIEFMFRIPGTMKIRNGITKVLLREAMKGILPEETRTRVKKTGWNAPAIHWFSGKSLERVRDLVRAETCTLKNICDIKYIIKIIDEHAMHCVDRQLGENHMMFIWQILNLERWMESTKSIPKELKD